MDDKEQAAIDALRAAGLEAEACAVERLRAAHSQTMDAYHAAARAAYRTGEDTMRVLCIAACDRERFDDGDPPNCDEDRGYTRAIDDCVAAIKRA